MATVRLTSIVADIRGSVGDQTYGRNPGGIFVRERVSPAQPESSERDLRQAAITAISQYWSATLSEAYRTRWRTYAATHKLTDRWGRPKHMSGFNHFLRCNVQKHRVTMSVTATTPPAAAPIWQPQFTFTADSGTNKCSIVYPFPTYLDPPDFSYVCWYAGHSISPGRDYYRGPWRYIGFAWCLSGTWTPDPMALTHPWTLNQGEKVFTRLVIIYPDGNTSRGYETSTIIS